MLSYLVWLKAYNRCGIIVNLILSISIYGILFFFDESVICIFNKDSNLVQTATMALPMFSLSFIPMALNLIYTDFMFSTKRTAQANVIAISRSIVIKSISIFCMPVLFGNNAIWIAPLIAELITLILAVGLNKTTKLIYK